MADVFISYSKQDRMLAESLSGLLQEVGFSVWWEAELIPAEDFREEIRKQITTAHAVIAIWSPSSVASSFVVDEADLARKEGKLISTAVDGFSTEKVPLGFRNSHISPLSDGGALIKALETRGLVPGWPASAFLLALFRDRIASAAQGKPLGRNALVALAAVAILGVTAATVSYLLTRGAQTELDPTKNLLLSFSAEGDEKETRLTLRSHGSKPFYVRGHTTHVTSSDLEEMHKEENKTTFYNTGSWAPTITINESSMRAIKNKGYIATCVRFSTTADGNISTIGIIRKFDRFFELSSTLIMPEFGAAEAKVISELSKKHSCSYSL